MAWDRIRQFLIGGPLKGAVDGSGRPDQQQVAVIAAMGQRIVDVVNESMRIAHESKNIETRRSRVRVARERMAQLRELAADYPFLKIQRLADVERDLKKIDQETDRLECPPRTPRWTEVRFQAMPRMTTPLASLVRHGEVRSANGELPALPGGGWAPVTPSLRETIRDSLGVDLPSADLPPIGATDVGAVHVDRYIKFLVALKQAATSSYSIDECALAVDAICEQPSNRDYLESHGGARTFIERLFPTVLELLDFIPPLVRSDMAAAGLTTVERIGMATDESLLAIAGLGPTRLRKLRAWCRAFRGDRQSSRLAADHSARLRGFEW